jgi:hypothetical protein
VEKYNDSLTGYFNGLIQPTEAERTLNGYKMRERKRIDAEKQVFIALDAFQKNAFFVLVNDRQAESLEEKKVSQNTNIIEDIYTLLTPTSKKDFEWEFDDNGSKIKCKIADIEFFNKYLNKQEKLGGNENLRIKMKIETFLQGNKIKKEYTVLRVIDKIPDINLFNYQDTHKKS